MDLKSFKVHFIFVQIAICLCAVCVSSSWAQEDRRESVGLIQSYVNAVESEDLILVENAWNELNSNADALEYMRQKMPKLHYSFQLRGLYFELEDIELRRSQVLGQSSPDSADERPSVIQRGLASEFPREVEKFSISQAGDARLQTNGDIAARSQGVQLRDNREIALANPNQNRQGNETLLRDRTQSYFDRKFQEPPAEMAPRGGVFESEPQSSVPMIKVFGVSTRVTFSQSSKTPVKLDVYLNDQRVAAGLKVTKAPEVLTLYLEPGANALKVSLSENGDVGVSPSRTITALFSATANGVQKLSLELKPKGPQIVRIEALPK